MLTYFLSLEVEAANKDVIDNKRVVNNFFAALFHDLPEALSRDIISPIKKKDPAIETLIANEEKKLFEKRIISLLPVELHPEFRLITGQLFSDNNFIDG
jgi:putative hydrolase of HD superfamily